MINNQQVDYSNSCPQDSQQKEWYDTLVGVVIVSICVNLFANWIYDKGREKIRLEDQLRERRRNRRHLKDYHGRTNQQAVEEENKSNALSYRKEE